jgi:predicted nucleotide-binding protein
MISKSDPLLLTALAVVAYAVLFILQIQGVVGTAEGDRATTSGAVLTIVIISLGILGFLAKMQRLFHSIERQPRGLQVQPDRLSPLGQQRPIGQKIFIVHGRDTESRDTVTRFIEKLGFEPIVLHEQPNEGRALINKFQDVAAQVGFAVVLMTPDDYGGVAGETTSFPRARQNVVFELGFFYGAFGPKRVVALVKGNVESPSDIDGVVYIKLDGNDWHKELVRELRAASFEVDWNKVMR